MTQDEIIEMAKQCFADPDGSLALLTPELTEFAKLIAKREREACANVCEETYTGEEACGDWPTPEMCATAIRARGQA